MSESPHPREKMPPLPGNGSDEALIEAFFEFKQLAEGRSERTVERYRLALLRLVTFMAGRRLLSASGDDLVLFAGKWLFEHGVRDPVSRRPAVAAVREFYKWIQRRGWRQDDPGRSVPHPKAGRRLPAVMTLAQAESLMFTPDYSTFEGLRDATMISILLGTGLRVSALTGLNESSVLEIEIDKKPRLALRTVSKGSKESMKPLPVQASLLLRMYMDHPTLQAVDRALPDGDKVLFISTVNRHCPPHEWHGERRRMNRYSVHGMIERHGRRAGLPDDVTHPHAIRHLFGTELAEDGVNLKEIAEHLDHAKTETTAVYIHLAMRKRAATIDKSAALNKIRTPVSSLLAQFSKRA